MAFSKLAVLALLALRSATVLARPPLFAPGAYFSTLFFKHMATRPVVTNGVESYLAVAFASNLDYAIHRCFTVATISSPDGSVSQTFQGREHTKIIPAAWPVAENPYGLVPDGLVVPLVNKFTPNLTWTDMPSPAPVQFLLQLLATDEYGNNHTHLIFNGTVTLGLEAK